MHFCESRPPHHAGTQDPIPCPHTEVVGAGFDLLVIQPQPRQTQGSNQSLQFASSGSGAAGNQGGQQAIVGRQAMGRQARACLLGAHHLLIGCYRSHIDTAERILDMLCTYYRYILERVLLISDQTGVDRQIVSSSVHCCQFRSTPSCIPGSRCLHTYRGGCSVDGSLYITKYPLF